MQSVRCGIYYLKVLVDGSYVNFLHGVCTHVVMYARECVTEQGIAMSNGKGLCYEVKEVFL